MDLGGGWDDHIPLVEFAYNNSYHSSIQMAPYEALYGRKCRSPLHWDEVGERKLLGPELVQSARDKVLLITRRLQAAQDRQKRWADKGRRELEFLEGNFVFLKISPSRGVTRFGRHGKLSPRYIGPFEVLAKVGKVAYKLALPPELSGIHDVFHVSLLRRYIPDSSHVLQYEPLQINEDLTYEEAPLRIVDKKEQILRRRTIPYVKVQWANHTEREATWELEEEMRQSYPQLFEDREEIYHDTNVVVLDESKELVLLPSQGVDLFNEGFRKTCGELCFKELKDYFNKMMWLQTPSFRNHEFKCLKGLFDFRKSDFLDNNPKIVCQEEIFIALSNEDDILKDL
ncbi:uncharacterized protein LOC120106896 [Phoenix dactylifera]|uniref:Uncharacterized protein LOC120106896 n=1 Tax=Phoenix dactylifera TaxID=42345 RepID=A0A8B8ZX60_PHODC|nr:uncharacterized protein LOC120106896 [Phoenix dactylifera]